MTIDCGTFRLRPLTAGDAGSMAAYANNYHIWRNVRDYFPHPYKLEDATGFILLNEGVHPPVNLCIEVEGACAGVIGFNPQEDVYSKTADFGYWLGEPFWGRGIMTTAARKTVDYIFTHFDIVRIHAGVFDWNGASMRVLEKAGFRKDCVFEQSVFKDGQLIDEHRYSLLKRDWKATTLRQATTTDIEALHTVRMAVKENVLSNPALVTRQDYETFLASEGRGWLCEAEGRVAGFAIVDMNRHNVWALFVHPDFEGRGIGKRLQEAMLQWYFAQTDDTLWLSTGPGTRAEEFYRRTGWKETGTTAGGETRFEMQRADWERHGRK